MGTVPSTLRQSPHLRIHCINVFVRDQDRSLRFFVDQLGFNVAFDTRVQSGERWVAVAHSRDIERTSFALVSFDDRTHARKPHPRTVTQKQELEARASPHLEIPKHVQPRLFPQTLPPPATLEYAGVCIQARQVGGDYY